LCFLEGLRKDLCDRLSGVPRILDKRDGFLGLLGLSYKARKGPGTETRIAGEVEREPGLRAETKGTEAWHSRHLFGQSRERTELQVPWMSARGLTQNYRQVAMVTAERWCVICGYQ
jgi:hypothetical protein